MATQVQRRRGTASEHDTFTGAAGEVTVNTTNNSLHVHDGATAGGIELSRADGQNANMPTSAMPAGSVIQVATAYYTGIASIGGSFVGDHLFLDMAPKEEGSAFLFVVNAFFGYANHDLAAALNYEIDNSGPLAPLGETSNGDFDYHFANGSYASMNGVDDWLLSSLSSHYLHTPSTSLGTSSLRFNVLARRRGSPGSIMWNRPEQQTTTDSRVYRSRSTLTVMEIRG